MPGPESKDKNLQAGLQARRPVLAGVALASAMTLAGIPALPAFAQAIQAQSATDELLRQQERERVLREQQERMPDMRLSQPETSQGLERLPDTEADCVDIRNITLVGDSADQFQ